MRVCSVHDDDNENGGDYHDHDNEGDHHDDDDCGHDDDDTLGKDAGCECAL